MKGVSDKSLDRMLRALGREALTRGECPEDDVSDEHREEILQSALERIRELGEEDPEREPLAATSIVEIGWLTAEMSLGLEGLSENHLAGQEPLSLDCEACNLVYG